MPVREGNSPSGTYKVVSSTAEWEESRVESSECKGPEAEITL